MVDVGISKDIVSWDELSKMVADLAGAVGGDYDMSSRPTTG